MEAARRLRVKAKTWKMQFLCLWFLTNIQGLEIFRNRGSSKPSRIEGPIMRCYRINHATRALSSNFHKSKIPLKNSNFSKSVKTFGELTKARNHEVYFNKFVILFEYLALFEFTGSLCLKYFGFIQVRILGNTRLAIRPNKLLLKFVYFAKIEQFIFKSCSRRKYWSLLFVHRTWQA